MALVVFRCDAGPAIGSGHVMRCIALASVFAGGGWRAGFAATAETFASVAALERSSPERLVLAGDAAAEPGALAQNWPEGADVLVVDHYGRDAAFERACRPWAKRIVVIDDLADRPHDADVLADAAAESEETYRRLVPASCRILAGPAYAIVHPAFRRARSQALARRDGRPVERVLVSFGQIDPPNATMRALAALQAAGFRGAVDVALGRAAPNLAGVRALASDSIRIHVDAGDMPEMMTAADLAIGAGGVTAWERCCLGLPTILVTLADNQRGIVASLSSSGAAVDAGAFGPDAEDRLVRAARELLADSDRRKKIATAAAALVDGRAGERIMAAAIGPAAAEGGIVVRPAEARDEDWLFVLQSRPETRQFANDPNPPSPQSHHQWLARALADPGRLLFVAEMEGEPVAMLRFDRGAAADRVSIAVHPDWQRRGVGAAVLELAARLACGRPLEAEILPGNDASLALFEGAGYRKVSEKLFRRVPT